MKEFSYSTLNANVSAHLSEKINEMLKGEMPVIVCVGTDATIGDSFGPICGTFLENSVKHAFIYGSLQKTVTAKEISTIKTFISKVHPSAKVLVIDAAVGRAEDVGSIKISDAPIKPGLGANKDLPALGDVSIIAIISEKTKDNYEFLKLTRLSPVYYLAKTVAEAVATYIKRTAEKSETVNRRLMA